MPISEGENEETRLESDSASPTGISSQIIGTKAPPAKNSGEIDSYLSVFTPIRGSKDPAHSEPRESAFRIWT